MVLNKWDLVPKDETTMNQYRKNLAKRLRNVAWAPTVFTCAVSGQRVKQVRPGGRAAVAFRGRSWGAGLDSGGAGFHLGGCQFESPTARFNSGGGCRIFHSGVMDSTRGLPPESIQGGADSLEAEGCRINPGGR